MEYRIIAKKTVRRDTKKLPQAVINFVEKRAIELSRNPLPIGSVPIKARPGFYRVKAGKYRILYLVDHKLKIITIYKIGHRKDIYRGL